jgi:hypothetical protein
VTRPARAFGIFRVFRLSVDLPPSTLPNQPGTASSTRPRAPALDQMVGLGDPAEREHRVDGDRQ